MKSFTASRTDYNGGDEVALLKNFLAFIPV